MSWKEILKKEEPIKKSPAIFNRLPENLKQKVRDLVYKKNIPFNQALQMIRQQAASQQNKPVQQSKKPTQPAKPVPNESVWRRPAY